MQNLIDKTKLENLLIAHWTEFLRASELMKLSKNLLIKHYDLSSNCQIFQLKLSRFEIAPEGFLLWLEVIVIDNGQKINTTLEGFLSNNGIFTYMDSTKD